VESARPNPDDLKKYWLCACIKRKGGIFTQVKAHHPSVAVCSTCGVRRDDAIPEAPRGK
jgi:transcription elongation factor Elf1